MSGDVGGAEEKKAAGERGGVDGLYRYDAEAIGAQRKARPWDADVKFFSHCKVSALAAMKMLKHSLAGVEKGRRAGSAPVEIMGLMIGKADGDCIVILDACPLPVEGSETRVVADDAQVHMLELMDSMELRRRRDSLDGTTGRVLHPSALHCHPCTSSSPLSSSSHSSLFRALSHPFDVESYSHCFLSAVDVQTQSTWQNASPTWTAIVVDPLRSLAKQEPEMGCFRVFPPKHSPPANQCPDGSFNSDATSRTVRWGLTYHRYYQLPISYFLSQLGGDLLSTMSKNNLWVRVLSSSSLLEPDNRQRVSERVKKVNTQLQTVDAQLTHSHGGGGGGSHSMRGAMASFGPQGMGQGGRGGAGKKGAVVEELSKGSSAGGDIAIEQCKGQCTQLTKTLIFDFLQRQTQREERGTAAERQREGGGDRGGEGGGRRMDVE